MDADALALERRIADRLQLVLDLGARARFRAALRRAQCGEISELRVELAVRVALLEQVPLDLAAGGLRDALHRHDLAHLESGLLTDEPRHLRRDRQKPGHVAPVQHEHYELLGVCARAPYPRGHYLAELEPRDLLSERL